MKLTDEQAEILTVEGDRVMLAPDDLPDLRVGGDLLKPQTTAQVLRCFSLGDYTASVVEGELKIRGPQPLAGPLPGSIEANREEIIHALVEVCGGVWPPSKNSYYYTREDAA